MTPRSVVPLLAVLLCLPVAPGLAENKDKPEAKKVAVALPISREVTDYTDFTGRVEASEQATVHPRVDGEITKVAFEAGAKVKKGNLLFEIDGRLYQAELSKAEAEIVRAEAVLKRATIQTENTKKLAESNVVSKNEFDVAIASKSEAEAAVRVARAGLDLAKLRLASTKVLAPITGVAGRPLVSAGTLVKRLETPLVTVIRPDPAVVRFEMDERTALRLVRASKGKDAPELQARIGLTDEKDHPHQGKLDMSVLRFDPKTGSADVRVTVANADGVLMPGLSAKVRLQEGKPYKALLVAPRALVGIDYLRGYVLVVTPKNVVERKAVKFGWRRHGDLVVVTEGLDAADLVVLDRNVEPGTKVTPDKVAMPGSR